MVVIEVRNAELMDTVTKEAKRHNIVNGAIVSLIGAVGSFAISTMPQHDATKDIITGYTLPAEMTGTGEITNGTVHIHAVMATEGDQAVAGHLHRARQRGVSIGAAAARQLRELALVDAARSLTAWDPAGAYAEAQAEERESAAAS